MGLLYLLDKVHLLYKVHCSQTQKFCDSNLPSAIDLKSKENNMLSSIKKEVKSLPIIYDSCDDTDDNNEDSSDN